MRPDQGTGRGATPATRPCGSLAPKRGLLMSFPRARRVHARSAACAGPVASYLPDSYRVRAMGVVILASRTPPRRLPHRMAREGGEGGGALHRAQPCSDADRTEIADDRFSGGEVWRHGMEIAGVEPVRIPSLREQLLRLHRIVWVGIYRQRKLHAFQHDVAVDLGGAERIGVAERLPVDRDACRL